MEIIGVDMGWPEWAAMIFLALHVVVWVRYRQGFLRARTWFGRMLDEVDTTGGEASGGECPALSVIVAARNEEAVLPRLLDAISHQTYDQYELIIVDDGSDDGTAALVERHAAHDDRILLLRQEASGKKAAVAAAVAQASNPVCVFTDADCHPSPSWLAAHARAHCGLASAVVVGYSPLEGSDSWLVSFQQFDTTLNQFLAAAAIGDGRAYLAKGGNWSYSRDLHGQVGGFDAHQHHLSGDDTLFIQAVRRTTGAVIRWLDIEEVTVPSPARERLSAWLRQKRRQTSTGATFDSTGMLRAGLFYWTLLPAIVFALLSGWVVMLIMWAVMTAVFATGLQPVLRSFRQPFPVWKLPIFLPLYVLFISIVPIVGMLFPPSSWQVREPGKRSQPS